MTAPPQPLRRACLCAPFDVAGRAWRLGRIRRRHVAGARDAPGGGAARSGAAPVTKATARWCCAAARSWARHRSRVVTASDPTAHAEMEAIRYAARRLRTRDLGAACWSRTSRPCRKEAAAYWAGISRMVTGEALDRPGAAALMWDDTRRPAFSPFNPMRPPWKPIPTPSTGSKSW